MERTTFLKNYRIRLGYDGAPHEPDLKGPAISYEAMDERTAEPVWVTLVPAENIDPSEREQFEENASAAQKLRHANVAKVLDFGREGDDYVYVSERLAGETLALWVRNHGPMPADAVLRVAEQVVSVLSSAGFHKLPNPSIHPSDIVLVPGQTAEGSWPLVKVTGFGLPELMAPLEPSVVESEMHKQFGSEEHVAGIDQFSQPTGDIRSEIYSLGVTLYFLLSGVALSAEALQCGPKFSGFPKPLRVLLSRMLHRDPDRRPKDLIVVTELIRGALEKIERRRALSDRYGIPLKTAVTRQTRVPSHRLLRTAVAFGLLLALAAAIAPMVFPDSIGKMLGLTREPKPVGVLIGVPESSPPPRQPAAIAQALQNNSTTAPPVVASQPVNPTVAPQTQTPTNAGTQRNPSGIRPADVQQAQIANAQPEATAAPADSVQNSPGATLDTSPSADTAGNGSAQGSVEPPPTTASQSNSHGEEKSVTSTYARRRAAQSSKTSPRGRRGSVRSRVVGITADGRLILRLSSGRTAIVAPDEEARPRHRNRVLTDRDDMLAPPTRFGPDYFPDD
jgi:serine/threonine protein kinase